MPIVEGGVVRMVEGPSGRRNVVMQYLGGGELWGYIVMSSRWVVARLGGSYWLEAPETPEPVFLCGKRLRLPPAPY